MNTGSYENYNGRVEKCCGEGILSIGVVGMWGGGMDNEGMEDEGVDDEGMEDDGILNFLTTYLGSKHGIISHQDLKNTNNNQLQVIYDHFDHSEEGNEQAQNRWGEKTRPKFFQCE